MLETKCSEPQLIDLAHAREISRIGERLTQGARTTSNDPESLERMDKIDYLSVDLGSRFPIHAISLSVGDCSGTNGRLTPKIAFSHDGAVWSEPAVVRLDAPELNGMWFTVPASEASWTRHIRLAFSLGQSAGITNLHVWCEEAIFDLIVFRHIIGVPFNILFEHPHAKIHTSYQFVSSPRSQSKNLVGLALLENGAFGNCLLQYFIAINIARALNLKYIKIPNIDRSQTIFLQNRISCNGIMFIPANHMIPDDGYFLSGMFFDDTFQPITSLCFPLSMRETVTGYIRKLFNGLPQNFCKKPNDQLIIHIRSGDIFSKWIDPNYPQPPLAFYQMVIQRLLSENKINSVKLVFENRLNPVISALETYIDRISLPVEIQSGSLVDDVAALANGHFLAFGFGSFGPAVCHLSDRIEQVYYFSCNRPTGFHEIESINHIVEVRDIGGNYMKIGEWTNSVTQRQLMINYPGDCLEFDDRILA